VSAPKSGELLRELLDAQAVGMALYGMQGNEKTVEFLFVVGLLYDQLKMIAGGASAVLSLIHVISSLSRYMVLTLRKLQVELRMNIERWETINNFCLAEDKAN
jgi:hypothetical protein